MIGDFIYMFIGFGFGCVFMLNRLETRNQKTFEQVDEDVRKELALNKNLVNSLKEDLAYTKRLLKFCRESQANKK